MQKLSYYGRCECASSSRTVVEHSPHHRKDKGLRKAATAGKGRMKWQYKGVLSLKNVIVSAAGALVHHWALYKCSTLRQAPGHTLKH